MDKLKQIQKYQFWILLGVALILPLVAWFMARSGLIAAADAGTAEIKQIDGQLSAGPDDPNADWEKGLAEINKVQQAELRAAWQALYERQEPLMTWPPTINPDRLDINDQEEYRVRYRPELLKVREIVRPVDEFGQNGVIDLSEAILPQDDAEWQGNPPSKAEILALQEDLWLLKSILKSIAQLNESANTPLDAHVRVINQLTLRGGSSSKGGGAAKAATGSTTGGGGASIMAGQSQAMKGALESMKSSMGNAMGGGRGSGGGQAGFDANASFNPDDEFGAEVPAKEEGGAKGKTAVASTTVGASTRMERYVENKAEWKTRGFYLEVVMDHRHVPELLVALTNADFPTRITRVHQADLQDENLVAEGSGSLGSGASRLGGSATGGGMMAGGTGGGMTGDVMKMMAKSAGPMMGGAGAGAKIGGGKAAPSRATPKVVQSEGDGTRSGSMQALDDPMLATVAIDGLITIFKKPPEEKSVSQPGSSPQTPPATAGAPAQPPASGAAAPAAGAAAPNTGAPATADASKVSEPAAADPAGTASPAEAAAEEAAEPPASETSEPAEAAEEAPAEENESS